MKYYINVKCRNCNMNHRIDATNYVNKSITFTCNKCNSRIHHFVLPEETDQDKSKDKKISGGIFKDKKTTSEIPKKDLQHLQSPQQGGIQSNSSVKQSYPQVPVNHSAHPQPVVKQQTPKPSIRMPDKPGNIAGSAQLPPLKQPTGNLNAGFSPPKVSGQPIAATPSIPPPFVPKPGEPFLSELSTPGTYRAGLGKRKDYSYVLSEIATQKRPPYNQFELKPPSSTRQSSPAPIRSDSEIKPSPLNIKPQDKTVQGVTKSPELDFKNLKSSPKSSISPESEKRVPAEIPSKKEVTDSYSQEKFKPDISFESSEEDSGSIPIQLNGTAEKFPQSPDIKSTPPEKMNLPPIPEEPDSDNSQNLLEKKDELDRTANKEESEEDTEDFGPSNFSLDF